MRFKARIQNVLLSLLTFYIVMSISVLEWHGAPVDTPPPLCMCVCVCEAHSADSNVVLAIESDVCKTINYHYYFATSEHACPCADEAHLLSVL